MINQPDPVYSYTIPYYTSLDGETNELFVSEKTYDKYLQAIKNESLFIIHGMLHPIDSEYGEVTSTLVDKDKSLLIIGTKDFEEYTNELLDIAIAQELEKIVLLEKESFFRFLYQENTPETSKIFIDDLQQTLEEIYIAKRLINQGYRIYEREQLITKDILATASKWSTIKTISPFKNEHSLFLLTKLLFLLYVEETLFSQCKKEIQPYYPLLFVELENVAKLLRKNNLSTMKGRQKALLKIFSKLGYSKFVKKVSIHELGILPLAIHR